jgi:hypothetical protein
MHWSPGSGRRTLVLTLKSEFTGNAKCEALQASINNPVKSAYRRPPVLKTHLLRPVPASLSSNLLYRSSFEQDMSPLIDLLVQSKRPPFVTSCLRGGKPPRSLPVNLSHSCPHILTTGSRGGIPCWVLYDS